MAETDGAPSRVIEVATVLISLVGMMFGFVSPSDATPHHD
jgi:hypothetical protein